MSRAATPLTTAQRLALGIVLGLALISRIDSVFIAQARYFSPDERGYTRTAYQLLDQHYFSYKSAVPNAQITPGYPLFLAAVLGAWRAVAPGLPNTYALRIVQALIGMLLVWLIFVLTRRYAGAWPGIAAAAFWAAYPAAYIAQNMRITEGVYTTLFVGAIIVAADGAEKGGLWRNALAGALFGVATLVRPLAAPLLLVPYLVEFFQSAENRKRVALGLGVALACLVLVMSPWWIRNVIVVHKFVPLATQGGDPLLRGADPYDQYDHVGASPIKGVPPEQYTAVAIARIAKGFRTDPLLWASWYTVGKWWYFFREPWGGYGLWQVTAHLTVIVFLGGMALVHALWRRRLRWIGWVIIVGSLMQFPFIAIPRYEYPITPLLVVLAAIFLADVWRGDGARWLGPLIDPGWKRR